MDRIWGCQSEPSTDRTYNLCPFFGFEGLTWPPSQKIRLSPSLCLDQAVLLGDWWLRLRFESAFLLPFTLVIRLGPVSHAAPSPPANTPTHLEPLHSTNLATLFSTRYLETPMIVQYPILIQRPPFFNLDIYFQRRAIVPSSLIVRQLCWNQPFFLCICFDLVSVSIAVLQVFRPLTYLL